MDLNLIVLSGRLAADPEVNTFASGATLVRILVTTRSEVPRRRIDVLPVVMWDPHDDDPVLDMKRGQPVWVAGSVQRRFWSADAGRTSRVEIVAHDIQPGKRELSKGDLDGARQAQDDADMEMAVNDMTGHEIEDRP